MTKPTRWHVRSAKTQISLGIRPDWSESSLSAWRKLGSLATHWVHSEDSDQTGWMPRLIWVCTGRTLILLVLTWGGLFNHSKLFLMHFDDEKLTPPYSWAQLSKLVVNIQIGYETCNWSQLFILIFVFLFWAYSYWIQSVLASYYCFLIAHNGELIDLKLKKVIFTNLIFNRRLLL